MTQTPPETIKREGLTASIVKDGEVVVRLEGVLREQNPEEWLLPLFHQVTSFVVEGGRTQVQLDVRDLAFMNAGGFRALVGWLNELKGRECTLCILFNPEHLWQRVGVSSLKVLGGKSVTSEEHGPV